MAWKIFIFCLLLSQGFAACPTYSLNSILALTLLNNPELSAFSYDIREADARILQAGLIPNPIFDIESENLDAPPFRQTTFLLSQLIELGGKRKARLQFAQTESDRALLDYEVKKRQLFVDTTLLFIEALTVQEKIFFLEENFKYLKEFSEVVQKRVRIGKASIIEESNFIVLLNTALIDLKNAQNEFKKAKNRLAAQWGETTNDQFALAGDLDWIYEPTPLSELGASIKDHPELVRSYFEENVRAAKIAVEKSKAIPDASVRGGPRYLEEARKWVWVVGMSIPLPISDRNQGRISESFENYEKLEKEREAIWVKLLRELNDSFADIETTLSELDLLTHSILPAAQKAFDFSYKGYELARYNYLELIETERLYRSSKIRYLQALGDYHKAFAILQGLTGSHAFNKQQCG